MENTICNRNEAIENKTAYGMKWHIFLIWFSLFVSAIINIVDGIGCMEYAGVIAGAAIFGSLEIALGAFQIFVRFRLSGFKADAVNWLTAAQALSIALSVLAGVTLDMEMDITSILTGVSMILVNRSYYAKRAELFVN